MEFREWLELNEGLLKRFGLGTLEGLLSGADKALSFVSPVVIGLATAAVAYGGWKLGAISGLGDDLMRQLSGAAVGGLVTKGLTTAAMDDLRMHLGRAIVKLNSAREKDKEQDQVKAAKKIMAIKKILQTQ